MEDIIVDFIAEVFNEYGVPIFEIGSPFDKKQREAMAELAQLRAQAAELAAARTALEQARDYLTEWRSTPFFDSRDEWEKWARNFAARVDTWLAENAPAPLAAQEQQDG